MGYGYTTFSSYNSAHYDEQKYDEIDESEANTNYKCGSNHGGCEVYASIKYSSDGYDRGGYAYWEREYNHHDYIYEGDRKAWTYSSTDDVYSVANHNLVAETRITSYLVKDGGYHYAGTNKYYELVTGGY